MYRPRELAVFTSKSSTRLSQRAAATSLRSGRTASALRPLFIAWYSKSNIL